MKQTAVISNPLNPQRPKADVESMGKLTGIPQRQAPHWVLNYHYRCHLFRPAHCSAGSTSRFRDPSRWVF
jgi:hypothetical protein